MDRKKVEMLLLCNYNKKNDEVVGVLPQEFGWQDEWVFPVEQLEAEVVMKGQRPTLAAVFSVMVDRVMGEPVKQPKKGKKEPKYGNRSFYVARNSFVAYCAERKCYDVKVIADGVAFTDEQDGYEIFRIAQSKVDHYASRLGVSNKVAAMMMLAEEAEMWEIGRAE